MWTKSDKYNVFMLLWMILAAVATTTQGSVVAVIAAVFYAGLVIYHGCKGDKLEQSAD